MGSKVLFLSLSIFIILGCESTSRPISGREEAALVGAGLGAGAGAIVGSQVGETAGGAAIGAASGGVAGAMVGDASDSREGLLEQQEEIMRRQEEEIERQGKELQDLKRQQLHNDSMRRFEKDDL